MLHRQTGLIKPFKLRGDVSSTSIRRLKEVCLDQSGLQVGGRRVEDWSRTSSRLMDWLSDADRWWIQAEFILFLHFLSSFETCWVKSRFFKEQCCDSWVETDGRKPLPSRGAVVYWAKLSGSQNSHSNSWDSIDFSSVDWAIKCQELLITRHQRFSVSSFQIKNFKNVSI